MLSCSHYPRNTLIWTKYLIHPQNIHNKALEILSPTILSHFWFSFLQNLEKQLSKRFSIDSEFWRTSCKVKYARDTIELDIPHDSLRQYGCEVHTDLGCIVSVAIATNANKILIIIITNFF